MDEDRRWTEFFAVVKPLSMGKFVKDHGKENVKDAIQEACADVLSRLKKHCPNYRIEFVDGCWKACDIDYLVAYFITCVHNTLNNPNRRAKSSREVLSRDESYLENITDPEPYGGTEDIAIFRDSLAKRKEDLRRFLAEVLTPRIASYYENPYSHSETQEHKHACDLVLARVIEDILDCQGEEMPEYFDEFDDKQTLFKKRIKIYLQEELPSYYSTRYSSARTESVETALTRGMQSVMKQFWTIGHPDNDES